MKKFTWILVAVFALGLVASLAIADDDAPKAKEGDKPKLEKRDGDKPRIKDGPREGGPKMGPRDGMRPPGEGMFANVIARIERIVGKLTDDQKTKIEALDKERQEAMKAINEKFNKGVTGLLTEEQAEKFKAAPKPGEGKPKAEGTEDKPKVREDGGPRREGEGRRAERRDER